MNQKRKYGLIHIIAIGFGAFVLAVYTNLMIFSLIWRNCQFLSRFQAASIADSASLLAAILWFGIWSAIAARFSYFEPWHYLNFSLDERGAINSLTVGLLLAVLVYISSFLRHDVLHFNEAPIALNLLFYGVPNVVLVPIVEETYFRGMLFDAFREKFNGKVAAIVVTLLFVCLHFGRTLQILPISVALAISRLRSPSLTRCLTMHASFNAFVVLVPIITDFASGTLKLL